MKIGVLGAGSFGTALGGILINNNHKVSYFDPKIPDSTLENAIDNAKYILLCVPSSVAGEVLAEIPKKIPLIVATKGFLSEEPFAGFSKYMILSGPGFAEDIKAKKETKLTATDQDIIKLFRTDYLTFDKTTDRLGVLMCGALKNVYAIYAGMLNLKRNTKKYGMYISAVVAELKDILELNNADPDTVELSCGIADLKVTCGVPSRNFEFGQTLRGGTSERGQKTIEGISALDRVRSGEILIPDSARILKELVKMSKKWD